ncbi:hypothetical protein JCM8097_007180 [Rhodosporidiobolus ruineniae]
MDSPPPPKKTAFDIALRRGGQKRDDGAKEGRNTAGDAVVEDAVFGELAGDAPNYRGLGWVRTAVLLMKTEVGLGVLGIPSVLSTVGLVPGVILIAFIGALSTWCIHVLGDFKLRYPSVYSAGDVGEIIAGKLGREILGISYWLLTTFVAGAGMLSIATAFQAITGGNAACGVVWTVVGAIITLLIASIRTLDRISWLGWVGIVSIMTAIITLAVSVGVQDRPAAAPQVGPWDPQTILFAQPSFLDAMSAVSTIMLCFAGAPNFLSIFSEMKRPEDYLKSTIATQSIVTATYLIIGCVVYHYCGIYVSSPALGSAGPLMLKVCYGLALPALIVSCVLTTHLPAKYIFLRLMSRSKHVASSSWQHWTVWLSCVLFNTLIAFIIAEAVPVFDGLISLCGALFSAMLCLSMLGYLWLWVHRSRLRTDRSLGFLALVALNVFIVIGGTFMQVAGTVASIYAIKDALDAGETTKPFGC